MTHDALYDLLPAVYRVRNGETNEAQGALIDVLADAAEVVERDLEQLHEDLFIETCDPWVVPYIGDLLGVRPLYPVGPGASSQRAYVANTLGYRRRKGTLAVLERLAYDVTGWRAKAVEFFQRLQTTQYAKHVRLANLCTADLRDANALEVLGGPFETAAHTAEVRRIETGRGRYNIPNIGIFVWRLQGYPLTKTTAGRVGTASENHFTFSPLRLDAPLVNRPRSEGDLADLATEIDVPGTLRRRALFDELETARQAAVNNTEPVWVYFDDPPVLTISTRTDPLTPFQEVPADQILIADLSLWQPPPTSKEYTPAGSDTPQPRPITVAVDPVLGRMTFPVGVTVDTVEVDWAYGFSGDIGGGPYDRSPSLDHDFAKRVTWQRGVSQDVTPVAGEIVNTLTEAIDEWNAQTAGTIGVITLLDSATYAESFTEIELKDDSELLIVAADWPATPTRTIGQWVPYGQRPHLVGDISVVGNPQDQEHPGRLTLEGILLEGKVTVTPGNLGGLHLSDSTLVPTSGGLTIESSGSAGETNEALTLELERTICGQLQATDDVPELTVDTCIVDAQTALHLPGAAARIQASTIFGSTDVRSLSADNSIFMGLISGTRLQVGCVRFSFVRTDPSTQTPRRYRCQPDLALNGIVDPAAQNSIRTRIVPVFSSTAYGQPGYGQLAASCANEVRTGAEDGSEMGVFMFLQQPQRQANLAVAFDEYLRLELEAGVYAVT
jgi:hypothetical protein